MLDLLALGSFAIIMIYVYIKDCGLKINTRLIKINIKPFDYEKDRLKRSRPLTEKEKSKIELYCRRMGTDPEDYRVWL